MYVFLDCKLSEFLRLVLDVVVITLFAIVFHLTLLPNILPDVQIDLFPAKFKPVFHVA